MSDNKVGTYKFVAEPFHCDFTGKLTMSVLGNHLLNCAGFHAADRGFGIATLNENHYTWVLSRLAIELEEMPCEYLVLDGHGYTLLGKALRLEYFFQVKFRISLYDFSVDVNLHISSY
mgnify:CR=1 FL=1